MSEQPTRRPPMAAPQLPNELMRLIFLSSLPPATNYNNKAAAVKHLKIYSQLNHQWHAFAEHELYRFPVLSGPDKVTIFLESKPELRAKAFELSIGWLNPSERISQQQTSRLLKACPHIQEVEFRAAGASRMGRTEVPIWQMMVWDKLRSLAIIGDMQLTLNEEDHLVTPKTLRYPTLTHLHLDRLSYQSIPTLRDILRSEVLPSLVFLALHDLGYVQVQHIASQLKVFSLKGTYLEEWEKISWKSLQALDLEPARDQREWQRGPATFERLMVDAAPLSIRVHFTTFEASVGLQNLLSKVSSQWHWMSGVKRIEVSIKDVGQGRPAVVGDRATRRSEFGMMSSFGPSSFERNSFVEKLEEKGVELVFKEKDDLRIWADEEMVRWK
ncbi:hypothetical protein T439DRAFT_360603 [Meredithblackwellia eburnea MCA 4105]